MSITTIIEVFIGLLAALGGFEFIKYILNRKSEKRKASAEASIVEREADKASVELTDSKYQHLIDELQEELAFAQDHMKGKTEMIEELQQKMTDLVKEHQEQMELKQQRIVELLNQINDLTSENTGLTYFKCTRLKCSDRIPPFLSEGIDIKNGRIITAERKEE